MAGTLSIIINTLSEEELRAEEGMRRKARWIEDWNSSPSGDLMRPNVLPFDFPWPSLMAEHVRNHDNNDFTFRDPRGPLTVAAALQKSWNLLIKAQWHLHGRYEKVRGGGGWPLEDERKDFIIKRLTEENHHTLVRWLGGFYSVANYISEGVESDAALIKAAPGIVVIHLIGHGLVGDPKLYRKAEMFHVQRNAPGSATPAIVLDSVETISALLTPTLLIDRGATTSMRSIFVHLDQCHAGTPNTMPMTSVVDQCALTLKKITNPRCAVTVKIFGAVGESLFPSIELTARPLPTFTHAKLGENRGLLMGSIPIANYSLVREIKSRLSEIADASSNSIEADWYHQTEFNLVREMISSVNYLKTRFSEFLNATRGHLRFRSRATIAPASQSVDSGDHILPPVMTHVYYRGHPRRQHDPVVPLAPEHMLTPHDLTIYMSRLNDPWFTTSFQNMLYAVNTASYLNITALRTKNPERLYLKLNDEQIDGYVSCIACAYALSAILDDCVKSTEVLNTERLRKDCLEVAQTAFKTAQLRKIFEGTIIYRIVHFLLRRR